MCQTSHNLIFFYINLFYLKSKSFAFTSSTKKYLLSSKIGLSKFFKIFISLLTISLETPEKLVKCSVGKFY